MNPESEFCGLPLIAILRGITPERVETVSDILIAAGVRAIEIPLNSPDPFTSIETLATRHGHACLCGAGTVLDIEQVDRVHACGGSLIVAPHTDPAVIRRALAAGMVAMPGVATPTEAFTAIAAGARHLKLFPASVFGPIHLRALKTVLPADVRVYPVGGVGSEHTQGWGAAGAYGFGFGTELFRPDYTDKDIAERAQILVEATRRTISVRETK